MLERFIDIFKRAILVEMDAMRDRLGPFEVVLSRGRLLEAESRDEASPGGEDSFLHGFHIAQANDKFALGIECSLVAGSGDHGIESVAIITPYVEQSKQIRRRLSDHPDLRDRVECRTVHRFKGGERDMVIFDTVDAEPFKPRMLLSSTGPESAAGNLINVSILRARGKLIIMSDAAYFSRHEPTCGVSDLVCRVGDQGLSASLT